MNYERQIKIEEINGLEREKQGLPTSEDLRRKVDLEKHYLRQKFLCTEHMKDRSTLFKKNNVPVPNYLIPSDHLNECDYCSDFIFEERMTRDFDDS